MRVVHRNYEDGHLEVDVSAGIGEEGAVLPEDIWLELFVDGDMIVLRGNVQEDEDTWTSVPIYQGETDRVIEALRDTRA